VMLQLTVLMVVMVRPAPFHTVMLYSQMLLLNTARLLVKLTTELVDVVVTPITLHIDEIDVGN